jgi:putative SOS response-associated peptidase YedK
LFLLKNSIFYHLSNKLLYFAGIYNHTRCCAIVTVHAQEKIKFIHNRQLLLIDEYNIKNWLSGENNFNDNRLIKEEQLRIKEEELKKEGKWDEYQKERITQEQSRKNKKYIAIAVLVVGVFVIGGSNGPAISYPFLFLISGFIYKI